MRRHLSLSAPFGLGPVPGLLISWHFLPLIFPISPPLPLCSSLFQFAAKFQSILRAHVGHVACCSCSCNCRCCRPFYQSVLSFVLPYIVWSQSLRNGKGNSKMYPSVRVFVCVCLAAVLYVIPKSNNALIDSFPKVSHESHTKDRLGKGDRV